MEDALCVDDAGNALVAFHRAAEETRFGDAPTPAALVALWHDDRLLLAFNRFRAAWELPGGMLDPGETPREAAVRELREETGAAAGELVFAGFARVVLGPERRVEYTAIFTGRAAPHRTFVPNAEVSAITWWDGARPLAGPVQPLDVTMARLARWALPPVPDGFGGGWNA